MRERIFRSAGKQEEKERNSSHHIQKTWSNSKKSPVDRLLFLQRTIGNKAVEGLIRSWTSCADLKEDHSPPMGSIPTFFIDEGSKGPVPTYLEECSKDRTSSMLNLEPRAFINHGRLGVETYWVTARGRGGSGLQNAGAIGTRAPVIETSTPTPDQPVACVQRGTGRAQVFRGYYAVRPGDQGRDRARNRWYITESAAQRINLHEQRHTKESQKIHDQIIQPLENNVDLYRCGNGNLGPVSGITTEADISSQLSLVINWNTAIRSFRVADRARNERGGTLDTEFESAPDAPQLRTQTVNVNGIDYQRCLHMPGETCTPSSSP